MNQCLYGPNPWIDHLFGWIPHLSLHFSKAGKMSLETLWGAKERGISESQTNVWNKSWILILDAESHNNLTRQVFCLFCPVSQRNQSFHQLCQSLAGLFHLGITSWGQTGTTPLPLPLLPLLPQWQLIFKNNSSGPILSAGLEKGGWRGRFCPSAFQSSWIRNERTARRADDDSHHLSILLCCTLSPAFFFFFLRWCQKTAWFSLGGSSFTCKIIAFLSNLYFSSASHRRKKKNSVLHRIWINSSERCQTEQTGIKPKQD